MTQEEINEASSKVCDLLRKTRLTDEERTVGAFDDDWLIEHYQDEWSWFMEGWKAKHDTMRDSDNPYLLEGDELKRTTDARIAGKPF